MVCQAAGSKYQSKIVCQLLDQKLMKLLLIVVEKDCCLDLNQNFRTREAEQNKLSCLIKLIVDKALDWITPEAVEIGEQSFGLG